jgi:hypothetical protein
LGILTTISISSTQRDQIEICYKKDKKRITLLFYHNHRRYNSGERAHKTPYEILSGNTQEKDWLALLFEMIGDDHALTGKAQRFRYPGFLFHESNPHVILCCGPSDDYQSVVESLR